MGMHEMHQERVKESFLKYSRYNSDIIFICKDGQQILSSKFLLGVYSPLLKNIFNSFESSANCTLYLPIASVSAVNLLKVLAGGKVESKNKSYLYDIIENLKLLDISLGGWELIKMPVSEHKSEVIEEVMITKGETEDLPGTEQMDISLGGWELINMTESEHKSEFIEEVMIAKGETEEIPETEQKIKVIGENHRWYIVYTILKRKRLLSNFVLCFEHY